MEPYNPHTLPLKIINWERHIILTERPTQILARHDGILLGMINP